MPYHCEFFSCKLLAWKQKSFFRQFPHFSLPQEDSFRATSTDRATHLLRATNAAIHLQARTRLLLRDRGRRGAMSEGEQLAISEFLSKNFYKVILEEGLLPNSETVEVSTKDSFGGLVMHGQALKIAGWLTFVCTHQTTDINCGWSYLCCIHSRLSAGGAELKHAGSLRN